MATTPSPQTSEPDSAVTLRGTQRGLELEIPPGSDADQILDGLRDKLAESPSFFAGNDIILSFLGDVAAGSLGKLEALCAEYDLSIVGIRSPRANARKAARAALAVVDELAEGSGAVEAAAAPVITPPPLLPKVEATEVEVEAIEAEVIAPATEARTHLAEARSGPKEVQHVMLPPATEARTHLAEARSGPKEVQHVMLPPEARTHLAEARSGPKEVQHVMLPPEAAPAPIPAHLARFVRGPIRSGVVLEADEHLVILGDVNPGAEVRSLGGITVLGRLRGIAHAGAGDPSGSRGFILALELAPQQLRIGELVARAGDDKPPGRAEIAFAKDNQIIVETYRGALPRPLWELIA